MNYTVSPAFTGVSHSPAADPNRFDFISMGRRGPIAKRVTFIPTLSREVYNVSFGDITGTGETNIHTVTDNGDRDEVLAAVLQVIDNYTAAHPDRWLFFWGSTPERVRLFRMMIGRHLEELSRRFYIYGEVNNQFVPFHRNMDLKGFLLRKKSADATGVPAVPRYYSKGGRVWVRGEVV